MQSERSKKLQTFLPSLNSKLINSCKYLTSISFIERKFLYNIRTPPRFKPRNLQITIINWNRTSKVCFRKVYDVHIMDEEARF